MKPHSIFEHETFTAFEPSPSHLRLLNRENTRHQKQLLHEISLHGKIHFRATQHVGVLRLGNTTLQILPKMFQPAPHKTKNDCEKEATRNLLTLLAYAHDLPLLHHAAPLHHHAHDWLELLTHFFATTLLKELHAAPHRNYQSLDDDLPLLRGKLRIADQVRRPDRQHRFACTFDEFTLDNPLNRLFRFVTERLFFQTTSSTNRQLLHQLRTLLEEVTLPAHCVPTDADPAKLITRLNRRYQPALHLARLFLSHDAPHLTHGQLETLNFLLDMNALFESFLANFLKKHRTEILTNLHLRNATLRTQSPRKFLLHEPAENCDHFQLHPDLTFQTETHFPLIIDTKYKRLDPHEPRYNIAPADIYQMLAYAHRYACPRILLLYPQTADMPALLQKIFTLDATTTITAATINLTQNLTTSSGRLALIKELKHLLNTLTPSPV